MNIGVIFAGGVGHRMHSKDLPKQFLELYNKPIIIHTLEIFQYSEEIDAIVIACVENWIPHLQSLLYRFRIDKVKKVVPGGESGQLSIYHGLLAAKEVTGGEDAVVLIHDGVRPLITGKVIHDNIACVRGHGSAITTAVVKETILVTDGQGRILHVPDRANSRVAKAPQSFWLRDVLCAHERALEQGRQDFIDTCSMMQYFGHTLHLVDGPSENIKITTPDDFYTMRAILQSREDAQIYPV